MKEQERTTLPPGASRLGPKFPQDAGVPTCGTLRHQHPSCWAGHGSLRGEWGSFSTLDFKLSVEICSFWHSRQACSDLIGRSFTQRNAYLDFQRLSCGFQKARCWYFASGYWKKRFSRFKISLLTIVAIWIKYNQSSSVCWVLPHSPTRKQILFFPAYTFTEKIVLPLPH